MKQSQGHLNNELLSIAYF